jgi:hypothetical protein
MKNAEFQLRGKLTDFNLHEVVQFLHMNRKTGELVIYADDHVPLGSVFLIQGELVHANLKDMNGTAAFDQIMMLHRGYFVFLADRICENLTIEQPIEALLMEAHIRHDELNRYRAELPTAGTILSIVNDLESVPSVNTCEWKILSLINGKRTIGRISQKVGDEHTTLSALHSLLAKGLIITQTMESPIHTLTPQPIPATSMSAERQYPPRLRSNLLLKAIDGHTTIKQLADGLKMEMAKLAEDICLLLDLRWISFNAADEKVWLNYCQDLH